MKIAGEVDEDVALLLREQLASLEGLDTPFELDLTEASFTVEPALLMVVEEVRGLIDRLGDVCVRSEDPKVRAPFQRAGLSRLLRP